MNTKEREMTKQATAWIYFPEDLRTEGSWGGQCEAITSSGQACTRRATHRAKNFQICSQHARSHYTVAVAR